MTYTAHTPNRTGMSQPWRPMSQSSLESARISLAKPTPLLDTFWRFAAERQEIFFSRLKRHPPPWTDDPIMQRHKFTNAYRASDRVSQYLIRRVIYEGDQNPREVFFRTVLFKLFNRIDTWELLRSRLTEISYSAYSFEAYDTVLTQALASGHAIYSGAYIMPSGKSKFGYAQKHRNHLLLLASMMADDVPDRIADSVTMAQAFDVLKSYPLIGNFLAYQYVTDLNYGEFTDFSEMEFTVAGPGAVDGIHKCFADLGGLDEMEIIESVCEVQEQEFARLGLIFRPLSNRRLQLIDVQNLFCEVSKYARVSHPDIGGVSKRKKIKQIFRPSLEPIDYWYPPKWGINELFGKQGDLA